jgi:hypothetical protein
MLARRHSFPTNAGCEVGRHRCRTTRRCSRGWYSPGLLVQTNRPAWGGIQHRGRRETSAKAPFSSRQVRIFSITAGTSMRAIIITAQPHSRQVSISILNTRSRPCAQIIDASRSAEVFSWPASVALGLFPPPQSVRGKDTVAACQVDTRFGYQGGQPAMKYNGSKMTCMAPCPKHSQREWGKLSRYGVLSWYRTLP